MNTFYINGDKIVLRWDGARPHGCDLRVHLEDVPHFWPHLKGHIRFLKSYGTFIMDLSEQNIARLQRQFGSNLSRTGGDAALETLANNRARIDKIKNRAIKAKTLPLNELPTYKYKLPPIGEYQHRGVVFLRNIPITPLFADPGVGKTYMVLCSCEKHIKEGVVAPGKTLICGKLTTLYSGWLEDTKKFTDLTAKVLWLPQSAKRKKLIEQMLDELADIYIINHDGVRVFEDALVSKRFEKVVVDESSILKSFHGESSRIKGGALGKALMNVSRHAKWRVIMSGTPAPNGVEDLWGQFKFLDPSGTILEPNFNDFRNEYYNGIKLGRDRGPRTPTKWVPKGDAVERVSDLVTPLVYRVLLRDVLPNLPERTDLVRSIEMSSEQYNHYVGMKDELRVLINDQRITASVKLTQIAKLRQITSGFIIDHQEKPQPIVDNPKLTAMDSLLEEEIGREHKVIIFCQFQWEIRTLAERYKDHGVVTVYGGNSSKENLDGIDRFLKDEKIRLFIAHPKSCGWGITLVNSHYLVFFSISYSSEEVFQAVKRIERNGQKFPMIVFYLLCNNSIDQVIYKAIQTKGENQQALIDREILEHWDL